MAGLDARHGKEGHSLACAVQGACPRPTGNTYLHRTVGRSLLVTVDLMIDKKDAQICKKGHTDSNFPVSLWLE